MFAKKTVTFSLGLLATLMVASCTSDKVLPKGTRIAVLAPVSTINPDVSNGTTKIKVPNTVENNGWWQNDLNAQHLIPNLKISTAFVKQWSADFGKGSSKREFLMSKPLVNGNFIYTLDAEGLLSAFNIETGESAWFVDLKPQNKNVNDNALKGIGLALDNGYIYATTGYGDVYAVNAKKGDVAWTKSLNFPLRIAPVVADGKIFVQSVDNKFWALDEKNGEILWKYDILQENTTLVGGAAAGYCKDLDVVITGFSNGELQAFNANIGTPLWSDILISNRQAYSSTFLNTIKASPVIENEIAYAVGNGNILTALDIRSGSRLWEKEIGSVHTPLLVGNVLYVVSNTNELVAIEKDSGNVLWATPIELGDKPAEVVIKAPVMFNSRIILALSNGKVYSYMPQTGKVMNSVDLNEELNSAPVASNGYIVFVTANARLIAYK